MTDEVKVGDRYRHHGRVGWTGAGDSFEVIALSDAASETAKWRVKWDVLSVKEPNTLSFVGDEYIRTNCTPLPRAKAKAGPEMRERPRDGLYPSLRWRYRWNGRHEGTEWSNGVGRGWIKIGAGSVREIMAAEWAGPLDPREVSPWAEKAKEAALNLVGYMDTEAAQKINESLARAFQRDIDAAAAKALEGAVPLVVNIVGPSAALGADRAQCEDCNDVHLRAEVPLRVIAPYERPRRICEHCYRTREGTIAAGTSMLRGPGVDSKRPIFGHSLSYEQGALSPGWNRRVPR